jgi:FixJ family two-component response regulator
MSGKVLVHIYDDNQSSKDKISSILHGSQFYTVFHPASAVYSRPPSNGKPYCCMVHFDKQVSHVNDFLAMKSSNDFTAIVLYSETPKLSDVVNSIKMGAFDFLGMPLIKDEVKSCLSKAVEYNDFILNQLREESLINSNLTRLTIQENKVLEQMLLGAANKIIAFNLNISQRTVENHRLNLMRKMSAKSIAHLVNMINKVSLKKGIF